jgi:flagellar hook-associated protein 3 FlgL
MSIISRISTYAVHQRTMSDFNSVQSRVVDIQGQISSGVKARDFKGLNGQVEQFTGLEATMRKTKQYVENNAESISRLETTRKAVSNSIDVIDQIENYITLRRNPANAENIAFPEQIKSMRVALAKELNTNFGGRFLFGGTRSDVPPVIDDPVPESITPGVPDTSYYQGSENNIIIRPQENFELEQDVRADNPGYQKIFAAVTLALKGDAEKNDAVIAQAYDLLQQGKEEVISVQARLDANIVDLNEINERHNSSILYLKGITEDIGQTDVLKASTQLAQDQAVLNASFRAFATVNNLRLVDYLR